MQLLIQIRVQVVLVLVIQGSDGSSGAHQQHLLLDHQVTWLLTRYLSLWLLVDSCLCIWHLILDFLSLLLLLLLLQS